MSKYILWLSSLFWDPKWELSTYKYQACAICAPAHLDDDIVDVQAVGLPQPSLIKEVFWNEFFLRRKGVYEFSRLQKP